MTAQIVLQSIKIAIYAALMTLGLWMVAVDAKAEPLPNGHMIVWQVNPNMACMTPDPQYAPKATDGVFVLGPDGKVRAWTYSSAEEYMADFRRETLPKGSIEQTPRY